MDAVEALIAVRVSAKRRSVRYALALHICTNKDFFMSHCRQRPRSASQDAESRGTAARAAPSNCAIGATEMAEAKDYIVADICAGRLGPQGNRDRRDRDAGADGLPRGFRQGPAAQGRAHLRLAAHDHPDGGADRDAEGARRRHPLGLLQHLLDPGPCRSGHCGHRHAGVRGQGRDARGILDLHRQDLPVGRRRHHQHDPRRWRRCHDVHPARRARRGRRGRPLQGRQRGRGDPLRADQEAHGGDTRLLHQAPARRSAA